MKRTCKNCGAEYEALAKSYNQKYCPECKDIMRRLKQAEYKEAVKQEAKQKAKPKKRRKKTANFDELTRQAKELGITYGKLQALIYSGTLEEYLEQISETH